MGTEPYMAMIIAFVIELACHFARLYMLVRSIEFPMWRFVKDVTLRVFAITIVAMVLPILAYRSIDITILRFIIVCLLSMVSTIGFGYYLGFNNEDRQTIKVKVTSIINKKILKRKI